MPLGAMRESRTATCRGKDRREVEAWEKEEGRVPDMGLRGPDMGRSVGGSAVGERPLMCTETGSAEARSVRLPCLARPAISLSPLDVLDHPPLPLAAPSKSSSPPTPTQQPSSCRPPADPARTAARPRSAR